MRNLSITIPGNEPYLLPGGSTGCLLLHGFSSMPEEMRPLGEYLAGKGYTVLGARLAGHATHPEDLKHTRWTDWLGDVEDGLAVLSGSCTRRVIIGQSLGGMIALTAAAKIETSGVVALSTPYDSPPAVHVIDFLLSLLPLTIPKKVQHFPPDHPLFHRRELNYPAYPEFPSRILAEMDKLGAQMVDVLPQLTVPVLLVHSRDDHDVRFSSMQAIYTALGSARKEMLPLEGMGHSLVLDPRRQVVFEAVERFLRAIGKDT